VAEQPGHVLVIDSDQDIADIIYAVLSDAGYLVSVLASVDPDVIRTAVGQLEPDCVLLDGASPAGYGTSWIEAAWLRRRDRQVPVIMFTVDLPAGQEAREATSARSQAAGFHAVLNKLFDLDELLEVVASAVGRSVRFDPSAAAEAGRTERLRARLEAVGAQEIHLSTRREWANFKTADGTLVQLYWWQRDGVYSSFGMPRRAAGSTRSAASPTWMRRSRSALASAPRTPEALPAPTTCTSCHAESRAESRGSVT
jgi:DNA-binding response OmpR family regulator